ncbi:MAG TPA: response regulator [Stellaceae bacterium]|jgi:two-component system chemotaxis response regulator CheY|nr:response regulator [Stellaceae bacterium]
MMNTPALQDKRVLIVDDDEPTRSLVRRVLKRMKIANLQEAAGAEQAIACLNESSEDIDLVICDWNMPGMSGIELFDRVHALRPELPFLMLTGRGDATSVIAAKKAGIPAYIVKPIFPQELKTKVSFLLMKDA